MVLVPQIKEYATTFQPQSIKELEQSPRWLRWTLASVGTVLVAIAAHSCLDDQRPRDERRLNDAFLPVLALSLGGFPAVWALSTLKFEAPIVQARKMSDRQIAISRIQAEVLANAAQIQGMTFQPQQAPQPLPMAQPIPHDMPQESWDGWHVPELDPVALKKQNTGLLVCGSSGSAKTTMIRACLPHWINEGYGVIVLDPHADPTHPEYPWGDFPYVVSEHEQIFEAIAYLLDMLKNKDRQKLICICDEWTDLLGFAQLEGKQYYDLLRNFIIRWGTGGRKFNKFLIGVGHTDNVEMWGLKGIGGLIRNFGILRLGEIAERYAEGFGKGSPLHQYCLQTAYPLLVKDEPRLHPTHGHYQEKENEQPPVGLQPLNFLPLDLPFLRSIPAQPINLEKEDEHSYNPLKVLQGGRCSQVATESNTAEVAKKTGDYQCPNCGSYSSKWLSRKAGRRQCKDCNKTWSI